MSPLFKRAGVALALAAITIAAGSWGFLIHKTAHQLAVYELPSGSLRDFFYSNNAYLQYNAPRADVRRNEDSTEGPKHFIDLEAFGPDAAYTMPLHWNEAVAKYSKDTLLEYGYVPYHVQYMKDKLTEAFKQGNKDSILFYAADLGHYVEDAHVPLHTSMNYDGQLTNQKGLHSLWESMVPELEIGNYNLSSTHKATYLKDPAKAIWAAIRKANALLPDVFGKEKELSARFTPEQKYRTQVRKGKEYQSYTTEFAKAYAAALKNTINEQAISSANLVADFWYTSWVDAGKPDLSSLYGGSLTADKKQELEKALHSFHNNTLVKDSLLKAR
ncbi:hypothetical protein SAMN05421788_104248 [Filimonas lacunae]|uniref:S1/P1 Nuclease n=1 Tax=Filimonas lacunae TaxID=477680 RepID=A0A173MSF1_9BACT|nr:zinc dependent phospholipase C family protein [Filimonas lacunae]BAV10381.1 hypothetical protein FLA_6443 [Filimonas lacunae]SIT16432.1 hypothetical protein SAMN05421788_104248 [Filimonas lacunae]